MNEHLEVTMGEALERIVNIAWIMIKMTEESTNNTCVQDRKAIQMVEDLITNHYQE